MGAGHRGTLQTSLVASAGNTGADVHTGGRDVWLEAVGAIHRHRAPAAKGCNVVAVVGSSHAVGGVIDPRRIVHGAARGTAVSRLDDGHDARRAMRLDGILKDIPRATLRRRATPGIIGHVGGHVGIPVVGGAAHWVRSQKEFETLQVGGRRTDSQVHVAAADPACTRGQANLVASAISALPRGGLIELQIGPDLENPSFAFRCTGRNVREPQHLRAFLEGVDEPEIDAEVCEPVDMEFPAQGRVQVHLLPNVESMACIVHHGPFVTLGESYTAIFKWIEMNGYRISGPAREIYIQPADKGSQTDPNTVTEIQFPVEKV